MLIYNQDMENPINIQDIRIARLREEINRFAGGKIKLYGETFDLNPDYLSQLLNKHSSFGEKAARNIETKARLPIGYLDTIDEKTVKDIDGKYTIDNLVYVPVISYVQAGTLKETIDSFPPGQGLEQITTQLRLGRYSFALRITGESMTPRFQSGDIIIIDPNVSPHAGDFVVAVCEDESGKIERAATFKKYRPRNINHNGETVFELTPLNEDYESIRSDELPLKIIGTMVEHRQYRKK